jgi:radical SAM superfamily enzyme YgiQ (UPF0313 family)
LICQIYNLLLILRVMFVIPFYFDLNVDLTRSFKYKIFTIYSDSGVKMKNYNKHNSKLLLTGIFGPYGVTDDYAEGQGMQMELLNNQITREQNIHSIRQHYWTLPLYLLAENISVPTVVLDFPKWDDFTQELEENEYTHVGINFIVPNVLKVKRMTEYLRDYYPEIRIILGGYGTIIPNLDKILPYDDICTGEGIMWLRKYFGEDISTPIVHPIVRNPITQSIYGFKSEPIGSVIMPGVGCKNGCEFCITSHKFGKSYIPLMQTGKDVFDNCEKINEALGATEFFVMDENFLKMPERARELLHELEKHDKTYTFDIFSSGEVIKEMGVDFLVRLGVQMVWVGVESKFNSHAKTQNIDFKELVADLQSHGITVNTSAILFLEHHTEETIQEDIDWAIDLGGNMTQFMNYTAYPTTALHERLKKEGRIKDIPYQRQTGQIELNWDHPHIKDPKRHFDILKQAFRKKYETGGSAVLNMAITAAEGYRNAKLEYEERKAIGLSWNPETMRYDTAEGLVEDEYFEKRIEILRHNAQQLRPVLLPNVVYAPNKKTRNLAKQTQKLYEEVLGKATAKDTTLSIGLLGLATKAKLQHTIEALKGNETVVLQPPTQRVEFNIDETSVLVGMKNQRVEESFLTGLKKTFNGKNSKKSDINPVSIFVGGLKQIQKGVDSLFMKVADKIYSSK